MSDFTPKWAAPILNSPINILTGAKCCINATNPHDSNSCKDCPFYPWYDCYKILQEQLDKLIQKEKEKSNEVN